MQQLQSPKCEHKVHIAEQTAEIVQDSDEEVELLHCGRRDDRGGEPRDTRESGRYVQGLAHATSICFVYQCPEIYRRVGLVPPRIGPPKVNSSINLSTDLIQSFCVLKYKEVHLIKP